MKTFFISSTFKDMQAERDLLHNYLFPALRNQMKNTGADIQELDLRWGVDTSNMSEEDSSRMVIRTCLDAIDICSPYMIVFIGERYGWIPGIDVFRENDDLRLKPYEDRELSITELEIMYGSLSREDLSRTVFCFRQADLHDAPDDRKALYTAESELHLQKLCVLKEKIRGKEGAHIIEYTAHYDPKSGTLKGMDELGKGLNEWLMSVMQQDMPAEIPVPEEQILKNASGTVKRNLGGHVERVDLLEKAAKLLNPLEFNRSPAWFTGQGGAGKSVLMSEIADYAAQTGLKVFIYFAGNPGCSSRGMLLDTLYYWICKEFPAESSDNFKSDLLTLEAFKQLSYRQKIDLIEKRFNNLRERACILIDALDQLNDDIWELAEAFYRFNVDDHLAVYFSLLPEKMEEYRAYSGRSEINEITIPGFTKVEITALAQAHANKRGKSIDALVLDRIRNKKNASNPFYLSQLLQKIFMMTEADFRDAEKLAAGMQGLSLFMQKRIDKAPDEPAELNKEVLLDAVYKLDEGSFEHSISDKPVFKTGKILSYMALSENGLTLTELEQLADLEGEVFAPVKVQQLFCYLYEWFGEDTRGKWNFQHRLLCENALRSIDPETEKGLLENLMHMYRENGEFASALYFAARCSDGEEISMLLEAISDTGETDGLDPIIEKLSREHILIRLAEIAPDDREKTAEILAAFLETHFDRAIRYKDQWITFFEAFPLASDSVIGQKLQNLLLLMGSCFNGKYTGPDIKLSSYVLHLKGRLDAASEISDAAKSEQELYALSADFREMARVTGAPEIYMQRKIKNDLALLEKIYFRKIVDSDAFLEQDRRMEANLISEDQILCASYGTEADRIMLTALKISDEVDMAGEKIWKTRTDSDPDVICMKKTYDRLDQLLPEREQAELVRWNVLRFLAANEKMKKYDRFKLHIAREAAHYSEYFIEKYKNYKASVQLLLNACHLALSCDPDQAVEACRELNQALSVAVGLVSEAGYKAQPDRYGNHPEGVLEKYDAIFSAICAADCGKFDEGWRIIRALDTDGMFSICKAKSQFDAINALFRIHKNHFEDLYTNLWLMDAWHAAARLLEKENRKDAYLAYSLEGMWYSRNGGLVGKHWTPFLEYDIYAKERAFLGNVKAFHMTGTDRELERVLKEYGGLKHELEFDEITWAEDCVVADYRAELLQAIETSKSEEIKNYMFAERFPLKYAEEQYLKALKKAEEKLEQLCVQGLDIRTQTNIKEHETGIDAAAYSINSGTKKLLEESIKNGTITDQIRNLYERSSFERYRILVLGNKAFFERGFDVVSTDPIINDVRHRRIHELQSIWSTVYLNDIRYYSSAELLELMTEDLKMYLVGSQELADLVDFMSAHYKKWGLADCKVKTSETGKRYADAYLSCLRKAIEHVQGKLKPEQLGKEFISLYSCECGILRDLLQLGDKDDQYLQRFIQSMEILSGISRQGGVDYEGHINNCLETLYQAEAVFPDNREIFNLILKFTGIRNQRSAGSVFVTAYKVGNCRLKSFSGTAGAYNYGAAAYKKSVAYYERYKNAVKKSNGVEPERADIENAIRLLQIACDSFEPAAIAYHDSDCWYYTFLIFDQAGMAYDLRNDPGDSEKALKLYLKGLELMAASITYSSDVKGIFNAIDDMVHLSNRIDSNGRSKVQEIELKKIEGLMYLIKVEERLVSLADILKCREYLDSDFNSVGYYYMKLGNGYAKAALEYFLKALDIRKRNNLENPKKVPESKLGNLYGSISECYHVLGETLKAREYRGLAVPLLKKELETAEWDSTKRRIESQLLKMAEY